MYLWKCWRDARLAIVVYLLPTLVELYSIIQLLLKPPQNMMPSHESPVFIMMISMLSIGATMPLVAWIIGGEGVGRHIADDNGAFLLTRPRARKFFLWADSGFSFALMGLMALIALLNYELVSLIKNIHLHPGPWPAARQILPSGLVFIGLIYAATYLCTMLAPRHGRVVSAVVLLGYAYLHHKSSAWGGITSYLFPTWWVNPFPDKFSAVVAPHFWLDITGRVIAIVVLLLIAQFVLERREIRA